MLTSLTTAHAADVGISGWQWPLGSDKTSTRFLANNCGPNGTVLGNYGGYEAGEYHIGNDQGGTNTTEVRAIGSGVIKDHVINFGSDGGAVMIEHTTAAGKKFVVLYGHLGSITKTSGTVSKGTLLGKVNSDHAHIGVHPGSHSTFPSGDWGNLFCAGKWSSGSTPSTTNGFVDPFVWLKNNPSSAATTPRVATQWRGSADGDFTASTIWFEGTINNPAAGSSTYMKNLHLAVRGPLGAPLDINCRSNFTLNPGTNQNCKLDGLFLTEGTYSYFWTYEKSNGSWVNLNSPQTFTLTHRAGYMSASDVWLGNPDGLHTANTIQFSATVTRAQSQWDGNAQPMIIAILGPDGLNYDIACHDFIYVARNGGSTVCSGEGRFLKEGTYTYWYAWRGVSSGTPTWYRLSKNRTFTITHRDGHMGASNIHQSFSSGQVVGSTAHLSATVTRAASPWDGIAQPMSIIVRGPNNVNLDIACHQYIFLATNGGTTECSGDLPLNLKGTYTYWYAWRGTSETQPWYRLSENRTFVVN